MQLLKKASKVLQCDLERIKKSSRVSETDKLNRDILLYCLWQEGKYTNLQIGDLFGLTHSSASRQVTITRKKMALEKSFERQVKTIKSQIKPWPHFYIWQYDISNFQEFSQVGMLGQSVILRFENI